MDPVYESDELWQELAGIPFEATSRQQAIQKISEIGRRALGSALFNVGLIDIGGRRLELEGCSAADQDFERSLRGASFSLAESRAEGPILLERFQTGHPYELHDLADPDKGGQGVTKPEIAKAHGLNSVLVYPISAENRQVGYVGHFTGSATFTESEKKFLSAFVEQVGLALERLDHHATLSRAVYALTEISNTVQHATPEQFMDNLPKRAQTLLQADSAVFWQVDRERQVLVVASTTSDIEEDYRLKEISMLDSQLAFLTADTPLQRRGLLSQDSIFAHSAEAARMGWRSMIATPVYVGAQLLGLLSVFSRADRGFRRWEEDLFQTFASHTSVSLEKAGILSKLLLPRGSFPVSTKSTVPAGGASELQQTLDEMARRSCDLASAQWCLVRLWSELTQTLDARAYYERPAGSQTVKDFPAVSGPPSIEYRVFGSEASYVGAPNPQDVPPMIPASDKIICLPLLEGSRRSGTILLGHTGPEPFKHVAEEDLRHELRDLVPLLSITAMRDGITEWMELVAAEESVDWFVERFLKTVQNWMGTYQCLIWHYKKDNDTFYPCFLDRISGSLKRDPDAKIFRQSEAVRDILQSGCPIVKSRRLGEEHELAGKAGVEWESSISMRLRIGNPGHDFGILEAYSDRRGDVFDVRQQRLFSLLASAAALGIRNLNHRQKLSRLAEITKSLGDLKSPEDLISFVFEKTPELTGCTRVAVARVDPQTQVLDFRSHTNEARKNEFPQLHPGQGISWVAIEKAVPVVAGDVLGPRWKDKYYPFWPDTRSALAVPLVVQRGVHYDTHVKTEQVALGVIVVESPAADAFTQFDQDILWAFAEPAALTLLELSIDDMIEKIRQAEMQLLGKRKEEAIISEFAAAIMKLLGFIHVNISLVDSDGKRIQSRYVFSSYINSEDRRNEYRQMADHPIKPSNGERQDIQSWVVEHKKAIVPGVETEHLLDGEIESKFELHKLRRVYVPMIVTIEDRVIGTVEAGYLKANRPQVFERDVQLLRQFVDYITGAIDQSRKLGVAELIHELRSPVTGIRNNADYLEFKLGLLSYSAQSRLLKHILSDAEAAFVQITKIGFSFGGSRSELQIRRIDVMEDIVFKTLFQFAPVFRDHRISFAKQVFFNKEDAGKVFAFVDRSKLSGVFFNLVMNAIKYCGSAKRFKLVVTLDTETSTTNNIIRVIDYGIGVSPKYRDRIFDEGFRAPEVRSIILGTGLGLSVARRDMRDPDVGGDLILENIANPTTFAILLPKSLDKPTK